MTLAHDSRTADAGPSGGHRIGLRRLFTSPGIDPFDEVVWELADARITNFRDGVVAFEQLGVEFPATWSQNARNIVAQKYFRGTLGTPDREWSLKQVVGRIVGTIAAWGREGGYFADATEADAFAAELAYILVTQRAAFNSPVWFNIGVAGVPQQASACFILDVDDTMDSILNWYREEGIIFKGGSGAGVNLSKIRSSKEHLKGGGTASGPVSFMRGADASAGTIKSGGKTRRAAKMAILNADHPDIAEFVWCKAIEERKARVLRDAGFDMDLDGSDAFSVQYQNANNSVRVTDEFMRAVVVDADWPLRAVTTGDTVETVKARNLWRQIAEAAWECADPGLQFDTTINKWHTAATTGRINASNPCFPGDTLVHTDRGLVAFRELFDRANRGEEFQVWTHDITSPDDPQPRAVLTTPDALMITGRNPIVRMRFSNGAELRCTPSHRLFTTNRGYVEAQDLTADDNIRWLDVPTPAASADWALPIDLDTIVERQLWEAKRDLHFPEHWSDELAHYLGWLVGDGSTSGNSTITIYGSAEDRDEILPGHQELVETINDGRPIKISEQANGTAQLRLARASMKRFVEALGVGSVTGEHKTVPWSIEQAPPAIVAAFLRGLFDADGTAVLNPAKGSYVGLGSTSIQLLRGVQRLLSTFGIGARIHQGRRAGSSQFRYVRKDGSEASYTNAASYDLRIMSGSIDRYAAEIGFSLSRKAAIVADILASRTKGPYNVDTSIRLVERIDDGIELTYNLSEPRNHSYVASGVVVRNCSEYVHLDNSACNLASLNLLKFLDEDGSFDVDAFRHAVEIVFTAQEILVGRADYPTEKIGDNARAFRQLGLGYANLGALLMALGLPYDSDEGRAWAAAITSLMTGHAYATSARTAARLGPFDGYAENQQHMLRVLDMHRQAAYEIAHTGTIAVELLEAGQRAWESALNTAATHGVRNSQATVIAPTGTIGFALDADTTGIEPDLGLVKSKKLVGGGTMAIVNQTIPRALARLGYPPEQVTEIVDYIHEHHSAIGAPHLAAEHLPVFACSMGDNTIHYEGHVRMMGTVQPFISGAISKTVNVPEDVTVEDVAGLHMFAWEQGLKAVAIYRDNCKVGQPLSTGKRVGLGAPAPADELVTVIDGVTERVIERVVHKPVRQKLPRTRSSRTFEFRVADCKGFLTIGEYANGQPGEIFLTVSKQGSTLAGIMDAFAKSVSYGLQYGVPLRAYIEAFVNMKFEPAGMTDDPDVRFAGSVMDYLFRRLALEYLSYDERAELGIFTIAERTQPTLPGVEEAVTPTTPLAPAAGEVRAHDAPMCMQCGIAMVRAGSCHACPSCGSTSGCS
jgi:ribonucleoside-diphosphate reductase alpha chain